MKVFASGSYVTIRAEEGDEGKSFFVDFGNARAVEVKQGTVQRMEEGVLR